MTKYNRNITELKTKAAMWWPEELKTKNALANVLPLLLKTQDDFLHLIVLSKNDPFQLFDLIKVAKYPSNLFLKHLAVLADYGGEPFSVWVVLLKIYFQKRKKKMGNTFLILFGKKKHTDMSLKHCQ